MKTRLLAFSDWRVQELTDIFKFVEGLREPVDLILYAGDDVERFEEQGINYLAKLSEYSKLRKVLAVIGNDDSLDVKRVLKGVGVHDLHEKPFTFNGFALIGLEASTSGPAIVKYSEVEVEEHLENQYSRIKKRGRRLIVLSHTPPHGVLDVGIRFADLNESSHHIGSKSLRNFLKRREVDLVVCGHCHSHGGLTTRSEGTTVINVSSHDSPGAKGNFALIEVNSQTGSVEVEWHNTLELRGRESLTYLHGVGTRRESALHANGIRTLKDLAGAKLNEVAERSGFSTNLLWKLQLAAKSVLENKIYQIKPFTLPNADLIFFDIETDLACQRVWLIGVLKDGEFRRFYADSWREERRLLKNFLDFLEENPADSILVSYSCTGFDKRVTERALHRLGLEAVSFLSHPHIDLGLELRRSFILPNQSFGLKDLGTYLSYPFKHPDLDGFYVALEYERHLDERRPLNNRVLEYNEDDVKILPFIINSLTEDKLEIEDVILDIPTPLTSRRVGQRRGRRSVLTKVIGEMYQDLVSRG